jgi:hypothetical protein
VDVDGCCSCGFWRRMNSLNWSSTEDTSLLFSGDAGEWGR